MENNTAPLRSAAPSWTLAGDKQLLDILQNIHQSLMTRCQEVNARLDEMVTALDGASVDLQNVNNKFMSLSNSQFIESRVYDDDVDVTKQEVPKEAPPPSSPQSELADLLEGVRTLQRCHETVRICGDSDSEDSDDEITSVVLRPLDVYGSRPLPLVIGTPAWRRKWHAGLLPEDSDSDSSTSKPEVPGDEYSDSEPEPPPEPQDRTPEPELQDSTTSSEIFSEQDILPVKPSPADVAAELARKLRGPATIPEEEPFVPPPPTTNKVYRPTQPATATIFSDEPPPFEDNQSEESEEEDDIFAELHKKPNAHTNKVQNSVADDLFGGLKDERRELFSDFVDNEILPPPVAKQKSTLFEDESEPELFVSKPTNKQNERNNESTATETVKKPIGGISLFGSNKGAESIGAAILKRNRRKSSSEEESHGEETKPPQKEEKPVRATEKDIFDDLFAKSEKEQRTKKETANQVAKTNKVDLFSDNLFDDIDDIFTTDVKTVKVNQSNDKKSIFDDSDDDLFANIAVAETKREVKSESQSKSVFDSDDDLFNDKVNPEPKVKQISESKTIISKSNETSKSLFDDDSSDSDMFSKLSKNNVNSSTTSTKSEVSVSKGSETTRSFNEISNNVTNNNVEAKTNTDKAKEKPPLLFDDDADESDNIFNNSNKNTEVNTKKSLVNTTLEAQEHKPEIRTTKTSLFDDEDDDDLFTNSYKSKAKDDKINNTPTVEVNVKTTNDYNVFNTTIKDTDTKKEINDISHNNNLKTHNQDNVESRIEALQNKTSIFNDDGNDTLFCEVPPPDTSNTETIVDRTPSPTTLIENKSKIKPTIAEKPRNEQKLDTNDKTQESKPEVVAKESVKKKSCISTVDSSSKTPQVDSNSFLDIVKDTVFKASDDIFDDLIVEPPAFEKAKEPKKSKNVNALFDDDSDDEALFFKKNDVTFDDKPNKEAERSNDPMFGIFHDEPPAIDVDFTTKSNKSSNSNLNSEEDIFKTIESPPKVDVEKVKGGKPDKNDNVTLVSDDELFKTSILTDSNNKFENSHDVTKSLKDIDDFLNSDSDSDLFQTTKLPPKPVIASKPAEKDISSTLSETKKLEGKKEVENETLKIKPPSVRDDSQSSDTPDSPETKKIGKLKTMNFNIDVSTLLPGASPKKKSTEQTDGQIISVKSQEDLHTKENEEESRTLVKTVSFEGEPDSQILDNKISKERAKIQVKRRPSTRRARKEAVRKSVLDLGEDSTDNSSSFDDAPKTEKRIKNVPKHQENKDQNENNTDNEIEQIIRTEHKEIKDNEIDESSTLANDDTNINIEIEPNTNKSEINTSNDTINKTNSAALTKTEKEINKPEINTRKHPETYPSESGTPSIDKLLPKEDSKNVKSKIVYILNDEDIFNTPVEKKENEKSITKKDDDLFQNEGTSISTIGNAYKEENSNKKSIFDDMSDEESELFNTNKKVTTKTKGILDSDSEDDLFFGKKEIKDKVSRVKETEVKSKSLFGDDDDEDDLFGAKVKVDKAPTQPVRHSARETVAKPSQPVLDDPLSLLGDPDD